MTERWMSRAVTPEIEELSQWLNTLSGLELLDRGPAFLRSDVGAIDRTALEIYIARRFGPTMSDPQFWTDPFTAGFLGRHRRLAERIMADHPRVTPEQMAAAEAALRPFLEARARQRRSLRPSNPWATALIVVPFVFTFAAIAAIISAWLFRGGFLLRAFGIVVVTQNGKPVSRARALWRALTAWGFVIAPILSTLLAAPWLGLNVRFLSAGLALTMLAIGLAGAVWAVVCPERGLQDRLAGTYLVPR
jgi:hypothetical protein